MMRREFLLGSASLGLAGCAHRVPWHVVDQAAPDPFLGQKRFLLGLIEFTGLEVGDKSETAYLAEKPQSERRQWAEAKTGFIEEFTKSVRAASASTGIVVSVDDAGAPFVIRPKVDWIEPGSFITLSLPSTVKMTISITDANGRELDRYRLQHSSWSQAPSNTIVIDWGYSSKRARLRNDGEVLGILTARYLISRVFSKPQ